MENKHLGYFTSKPKGTMEMDRIHYSLRMLDHPLDDGLDVHFLLRADRHDEPVVLRDVVEVELLDGRLPVDVGLEVDLVEADEERDAVEGGVLEEAVELLLRVGEPARLARVDAEDDAVAALGVAAPLAAEALLAAEVPHLHEDPLLLDDLDVEADGRARLERVAHREDVEQRRLPGALEAEDAELDAVLAAEERFDRGVDDSHGLLYGKAVKGEIGGKGERKMWFVQRETLQ